MRHGASGRRSRNRGGNRRGGNNRSQVFDSNGPDVRIRGTAHQIHEKYIALAKDATGSGDRILAESYLQHAEHYQRVINSWKSENNYTHSPSTKNEKPSETKTKEEVVDANKPATPVVEEKEDLGLPASILGGEVKKDELEDA